jgi:hypothetical protein
MKRGNIMNSKAGCFSIIVIVIIILVAIGSCHNDNKPKKRIEDLTNKEMEQFLEWDQKQQQQ